jgi:hypothetical protein
MIKKELIKIKNENRIFELSIARCEPKAFNRFSISHFEQ